MGTLKVRLEASHTLRSNPRGMHDTARKVEPVSLLGFDFLARLRQNPSNAPCDNIDHFGVRMSVRPIQVAWDIRPSVRR